MRLRCCGQNIPVQTLTHGAKGGPTGEKVRFPPMHHVHCFHHVQRNRTYRTCRTYKTEALGAVRSMCRGVSGAHGSHETLCFAQCTCFRRRLLQKFLKMTCKFGKILYSFPVYIFPGKNSMTGVFYHGSRSGSGGSNAQYLLCFFQ